MLNKHMHWQNCWNSISGTGQAHQRTVEVLNLCIDLKCSQHFGEPKIPLRIVDCSVSRLEWQMSSSLT